MYIKSLYLTALSFSVSKKMTTHLFRKLETSNKAREIMLKVKVKDSQLQAVLG